MAKSTQIEKGNWMVQWTNYTMKKQSDWYGNFQTREEAEAHVKAKAWMTMPDEKYEIEYLR